MTNLKNDLDFGFIVISAVRYALGRQSYAPSLICEWIKTHADLIPKESLVYILEAINEALDTSSRTLSYTNFGSRYDMLEWMAFWFWLIENSDHHLSDKEITRRTALINHAIEQSRTVNA